MINKRVCLCILLYFLVTIQVNGERTKDKMYERIDGTAACFRRLNATHQTGCTSNRPGSNGVIHLVNNQSELHFVLDKLSSGPYMVVMPVILLTAENMELIKDNPDKISGVIAHNNITRPNSFSSEAKCPNSGYGLKDMCDAKGWNPIGSGVLQGDYPFPVFLLSNEHNLDKITKCFLKFNNFDFENQGQRSLCALELQSFMFAAVNSQTCMRRANVWTTFTPVHYCDPLGDRNIWSTLFPWENKPNRVKDVILVVTRMDTTSLFNEVTPGAESSVTGLVTLLTTAQLLHKMALTKTEYKKNVFFVIFNGESYDYIGSQRLVYDIINKKFPMEKDINIKNEVPNLTLEDIKLIVEIGQINKGRDLYMHSLNKNDPQVNNFLKNLKTNLKPININPSSVVSRIPPSSIQSFLEENSGLSTLLITDHDTEFTNKYYNSMYDDAHNINYSYVNVSEDQADSSLFTDTLQNWIANVANATAYAIYQEVFQEFYTGEEQAKPYYVNELLNCYLDTANCKIYKAVSGKQYIDEKPLSLYVGVVASSNVQTALTARALAWLTSPTTNLTQELCKGDPHNPVYQYLWMSTDLDNINSTVCYQTTMNYSLAISPAFEMKDYSWESGKYSSWTESVWKELGARMYVRPSQRHELVTLGTGTLALILSIALTHAINKRSHILFPKPPQTTNSIPPVII